MEMLNIARIGRLPRLYAICHSLALWACPCRPISSDLLAQSYQVSGTVQEVSRLISTRNNLSIPHRSHGLRSQFRMTSSHSPAMAVLHPQPGAQKLRAGPSLVQILQPKTNSQPFSGSLCTPASSTISSSLLRRPHFERPSFGVSSPYTSTRLSVVSHQSQTRYNEHKPDSGNPQPRRGSTSESEATAPSNTEAESLDLFHAPASASWRALGVSETVSSALEAAGLGHPSAVQVSSMVGQISKMYIHVLEGFYSHSHLCSRRIQSFTNLVEVFCLTSNIPAPSEAYENISCNLNPQTVTPSNHNFKTLRP